MVVADLSKIWRYLPLLTLLAPFASVAQSDAQAIELPNAAVPDGSHFVRDSVQDCLNVRRGPSIDSPAIDCLAPGTALTVIAHRPGWREIRFGGGRLGWASRRYLEPVKAAGASSAGPAVPGPTALDSTPHSVSGSLRGCLNVRLTASVDGRPIDCLAPHTPVDVVSRSGPWREVALADGRFGWVSGGHLEALVATSTGPPPPVDFDRESLEPAPHFVREDLRGCLNVRRLPSIDAAPVDCLAPGTVVTVFGRSARWQEIRSAEGTLGWVAQEYLMAGTPPAPRSNRPQGRITLSLRDTPIEEVFEMLSRQARINILLSKGVEGSVSVSLYELTVEEAIRAVAAAAGYVVEQGGGVYMIVSREDAGKDLVGGNTQIRTIKVQYSDPNVVAELLTKHLSRFGKITTLAVRNLLVIEDLPEFLDRVERMVADIDVEPRQILIEAKILEIALDSGQIYGIDWTVPFSLEGGLGALGAQGLAPRGISGLFAEVVTPDFEVFINALSSKGRVRTLSTPKILVLENQEAEVVIGDRTGYRVTTTINQVTTESVEFIESGVILKVRVSVDRSNRVLLSIHPEVSSATVTDGIPSLTTTEVTTQMLAEDGQKIFIGGLIRNTASESRSGVPGLSDLPVVGGLFSRTDQQSINTETVVLITPHLIDTKPRELAQASASNIDRTEADFERYRDYILRTIPSANPLLGPSSSESGDEPSWGLTNPGHPRGRPQRRGRR